MLKQCVIHRNRLKSMNINSKLISYEDTNENTEICDYNSISDSCVGVYTIYDSAFDDKYFNKIFNKNIVYLITDDVEKLNNFLIKKYY